MLKYAVQMLLFTDNFTERQLPLLKPLKELGFDGIELGIGDPGAFPAQALRRTLEKLDLKVNFAAVLSPEMNSISPSAESRQRARDFLRACVDVAYETCGGDCVIGGPNYAAWCYLTGRSATAQEWQWAVENYKYICEYAQKKNIVMSVEVLNRYETHLFNTLERANAFCADVGLPNAKVQPDTFHMSIEEKNWGDAIRNVGERIGYVHVIENDRGVIGTGLVDWPEVFAALGDISYTGWLTIESFTREHDGLAGATRTWRDPASSAIELASQSLAALKRFERKHCR
jgi:D-psicose/D-tagatose/L-ribulose 3-epimerase